MARKSAVRETDTAIETAAQNARPERVFETLDVERPKTAKLGDGGYIIGELTGIAKKEGNFGPQTRLTVRVEESDGADDADGHSIVEGSSVYLFLPEDFFKVLQSRRRKVLRIERDGLETDTRWNVQVAKS